MILKQSKTRKNDKKISNSHILYYEKMGKNNKILKTKKYLNIKNEISLLLRKMFFTTFSEKIGGKK